MHKYKVRATVNVEVWADNSSDAAGVAVDKLQSDDSVKVQTIHGYEIESKPRPSK